MDSKLEKFGTDCWFCGEPVKRGKGVNKHHICSKRYGRPSAIHLAHITCHDRYNHEVDDSKLSYRDYVSLMESINWGRCIFAPALFLCAIAAKHPIESW